MKYKLERACHSGFNYERVIKDENTGEELISSAKQINFLEKSEAILADKFIVHSDQPGDFKRTSVRFLGCTLWTPHKYAAWDSIRYRQIGKIRSYSNAGPKRDLKFRFSEFRPIDAEQLFEESIAWLGYKLKQQPDIPTVIVTHHAPSYKSNIMPDGEKYIPDFHYDIQDAYMNHLEDFILEHQSNLKLWVHGHLHGSADYMIGDTRIVCNPRGRGSAEEKNPSFDPKLIIEVEGR